jgi:hypothetical protein
MDGDMTMERGRVLAGLMIAAGGMLGGVVADAARPPRHRC